MAKSRKRRRAKKGCRIVKGGGCLCGRKFAKKSRCGVKRKSAKSRKRSHRKGRR